jgi:hypothetical protein
MAVDPHDGIAEGVTAAMELSFTKLLRLGYTPDNARIELLRLTREAVQ